MDKISSVSGNFYFIQAQLPYKVKKSKLIGLLLSHLVPIHGCASTAYNIIFPHFVVSGFSLLIPYHNWVSFHELICHELYR